MTATRILILGASSAIAQAYARRRASKGCGFILVGRHEERLGLGKSALVCPWLIALLAAPVLAGLFWAMRGLAPTHLRAAGFAAGLTSGAAGAWVYAFHCPESALPFIALWYTAGILVVGAAGLVLGPRLLRW